MKQMQGEYMDNLIAIGIGRNQVKAYEYRIVTETSPDFLPPATLVNTDGKNELLYSCEGLVPVLRSIEEPGSMPLSGLFDILLGYIHCIISARDMLLDTRLISSDPETGVFLMRGPGANGNIRVKSLWGADELSCAGEKICRVANALAGCDRVMGSRTAMERMIEFIRSENPSLLNCLKMAEIACREWNNIVSSDT